MYSFSKHIDPEQHTKGDLNLRSLDLQSNALITELPATPNPRYSMLQFLVTHLRRASGSSLWSYQEETPPPASGTPGSWHWCQPQNPAASSPWLCSPSGLRRVGACPGTYLSGHGLLWWRDTSGLSNQGRSILHTGELHSCSFFCCHCFNPICNQPDSAHRPNNH